MSRRTWQPLLLVLALSLHLVASDEIVPEVDSVYRRGSRRSYHQCDDRNLLQDGFKYEYIEWRCSSSYDCDWAGMAPACAVPYGKVDEVLPREKGFRMEPGTDYTEDARAGLFGWCCKEESSGPIMDICDPTTTSLCDCYAIATRTEKCRTKDDMIVEPQDCTFQLTDEKELGLGCSVVWSTSERKCGIRQKGTVEAACSALKNRKDCESLSSCCFFGKLSSCRASSELSSCEIRNYRTWSQKELEDVAAQTCPSAGRKLDANMIKDTV